MNARKGKKADMDHAVVITAREEGIFVKHTNDMSTAGAALLTAEALKILAEKTRAEDWSTIPDEQLARLLVFLKYRVWQIERIYQARETIQAMESADNLARKRANWRAQWHRRKKNADYMARRRERARARAAAERLARAL